MNKNKEKNKYKCNDQFCTDHNDLMRGCEDEKLSAFELANFKIVNYPDEYITYVKFLDDNDPRLLLLVTYD